MGDKVRQGAHHGAQQSTRTDVSEVNTSRVKVLSVTSKAAIFGWAMISGSWHLPHIGFLFKWSSGILFFVPHLRQGIIKSSNDDPHLPHLDLPCSFLWGILFFVPQFRQRIITLSGIFINLSGAVEKRSYPEGHHGLLCCAANRTARRMSIYASRFGFYAPCIWTFLNSPRHWVFQPPCCCHYLFFAVKRQLI